MIINHLVFTLDSFREAVEEIQEDESVTYPNEKQGTIWVAFKAGSFILIRVIRHRRSICLRLSKFCPYFLKKGEVKI